MWWRGTLKAFRFLFSRAAEEREINEELAAHIELQVRKHVIEGMGQEEARRQAQIEFGGLEVAREECRDVTAWRPIDTLARNLKLVSRSLAKSPGFTLIAILILALGVGSNLAVFSLLDALLLRPLPVERPEELVRISSIDKEGHLHGLPSTMIDSLRKDTTFEGLCGFDTSYQAAEIDRTIQSTGRLAMTGDCFKTLGIHVQLGRPITPTDDYQGSEGIAVITESLWRSRFAGNPDVLGKRILMQGAKFTIVGVAEKRFSGLLLGFPAGIVIPLRQVPTELPGGRRPTYYWVNILARRAPGISQAQVLVRITAERERLLADSVPHRYNTAQRKNYLSRKLTVTSARTGVDYFLRDRFGKPLYAVFGICASILLIGCVNLANLLLARSLTRRREIAVRLALGAKRTQIAGMFALEASILIAVGAAAGVVLARWMDRLVVAQAAQMFGNFDVSLTFDSRVALFLAGAMLLIIGGVAGTSAWQANRLCGLGGLKEGGRGQFVGNSFAQKTLLGLQIALTLALVTGSGLFTSSLKRFYRIDLGVKTRNVWAATLERRPGASGQFAQAPYYRAILHDMESMPNIGSVTLCQFMPFFTAPYQQPVAPIENAEPGRELQAQEIPTADGFFRTLGAKIVAGEDFHRDENTPHEPSVILSESLAKRLGDDPRELVGHHVRLGAEAAYQHLKVVGIASNVQLSLVNPDERDPFIVYTDFWQHLDAEAYPVLLIKTSGGTLNAADLRHVVDARGREYVERFSTLDSEKDGALIEDRLLAYLSGAFGALALLMAATGLFGLLSYQVTNRTGEIGIRMALGAERIQIQWLVVRQILGLLAIGTLIGVVLTLLVGKVMGSLLYGMSAYNPLLLAVSLVVLTSVALIAAWLPARRAASVDPLVALRHD